MMDEFEDKLRALALRRPRPRLDARVAAQRPRPVWWRRRVAVPLPVAAGFMMIFLAMLVMRLPSGQVAAPDVNRQVAQAAPATVHPLIDAEQAARLIAQATADRDVQLAGPDWRSRLKALRQAQPSRRPSPRSTERDQHLRQWMNSLTRSERI